MLHKSSLFPDRKRQDFGAEPLSKAGVMVHIPAFCSDQFTHPEAHTGCLRLFLPVATSALGYPSRMRLPFNLLACCPSPGTPSSPELDGQWLDLGKICALMPTGVPLSRCPSVPLSLSLCPLSLCLCSSLRGNRVRWDAVRPCRLYSCRSGSRAGAPAWLCLEALPFSVGE